MKIYCLKERDEYLKKWENREKECEDIKEFEEYLR